MGEKLFSPAVNTQAGVFSPIDFCGIIMPIMPFPQLPAQVHDVATRVESAVGDFFSMLVEKAAELRDRAQLVVDKLLPQLPPEKRRLVLYGSVGGVAVFVLIFAIIMPLAMGTSEQQRPQAAAAPLRQDIIPADELFLPLEPDSVPGLILDREQRSQWTADDARPLWQDPLKNGEEPWRDRIEKTIDEIMESVP